MKDMNRLAREYVLRAISDDYEDFERIVADVSGWAAERGTTVDRQKALKALEELIKEGYAQTYFLSAGPPGRAEPALYSADSIDDLWFYVTPKGKELALQLQEQWQ